MVWHDYMENSLNYHTKNDSVDPIVIYRFSLWSDSLKRVFTVRTWDQCVRQFSITKNAARKRVWLAQRQLLILDERVDLSVKRLRDRSSRSYLFIEYVGKLLYFFLDLAIVLDNDQTTRDPAVPYVASRALGTSHVEVFELQYMGWDDIM